MGITNSPNTIAHKRMITEFNLSFLITIMKQLVYFVFIFLIYCKQSVTLTHF